MCSNDRETDKKKWPRGRRKADTKPIIKEIYRIHVESVSKSETAYKEFLHRESCFVLISNETGMSEDELIRTYKGQQTVENSFRMLKSPQLASVIYLKDPKRIQVLQMLLTFSLLLRAVIQFRLRDGLEKFEAEHPEEKIRAGWGGRVLEKPTYKLLYEHSINCCFEHENDGTYSFTWLSVETKNKVAPLLTLMGCTLEQLLE